MIPAIGAGELMIGIAYSALGFLTLYELMKEGRSRGASQFGMALMLMALTCGPHHLVRAGLTFSAESGTLSASGHAHDVVGPAHSADWSVLLAMLIALPAGIVFVGLRIEALFGAAGDRTIRMGASLLPGLAAAIALAAGAIVVWEVTADTETNWIYATFNAVLAAAYLMVGWYILTTQLRRYALTQTWSLSGLSLGFLFPTCALLHVSHLLAGSHALGDSGLAQANSVINVIGIPAAIWFLIVVRRLYHEGFADWNRRPLVGRRLDPRRVAPWELASGAN